MTWEFYSALVYCWDWTFYIGLLSVNNDTSMTLLTVHIVPYLTPAKLGSGNETVKVVSLFGGVDEFPWTQVMSWTI